MTDHEHKRRLAQAQRVSALRERRSERARREAIQAERDARVREAEACERLAAAETERASARSAFFEQVGCEQAEIWLIASQQREQHAASAHGIASEKSDSARAVSTAARREHERLRERGALLETQAQAAIRRIAARARDREDEDMQERIR